MSRRYSITPAARSDLFEIDSYLRGQSPRAAAQVREELRSAMRRLAQRPGMGHVREDLADEALRFWPVCSDLIISRAEVQPVEIVRVLHGSREVSALLAGR